jgi:8-oxo-dGTP pyrophosphatase MutT (NUDIX family)
VSARGGRQRIPRPPTARPGGPPPWAHLPPERRRLSLATVRDRLVTLPPARRPGLVAPGSHPAGVLVPLHEAGGEARVILTKRPETMPSHQGEIAFPGGRVQPHVDGAVVDAALRETEEEIGLPRELIEVAAELDTLATVASRFTVTPFVGLLAPGPVLHPDPREVVRVLDVALSELLDDAVYREERWELTSGPPPPGWGPGPHRTIHFFELEGETVWGATARILADLLTHLTGTR